MCRDVVGGMPPGDCALSVLSTVGSSNAIANRVQVCDVSACRWRVFFAFAFVEGCANLNKPEALLNVALRSHGSWTTGA